jgi:hypothetical protein
MLSPRYSRGFLSAFEAIRRVGPRSIFRRFSKIDITLIQFTHTYNTATRSPHLLFECYCTAEGFKINESLMQFIISDLYLYYRTISLLSNHVLFAHLYQCCWLRTILMLNFSFLFF